MSSRRSMLVGAAGWVFWRQAQAQVKAAESLPPLVAVAQARARLDAVQALRARWSQLDDHAALGTSAAENTRYWWSRLGARHGELLKSNDGSAVTLASLRTAVSTCENALGRAQAALPPWHHAVALLARARPEELRVATGAADAALSQSREADEKFHSSSIAVVEAEQAWWRHAWDTTEHLESAMGALREFKESAIEVVRRYEDLYGLVQAAKTLHHREVTGGQVAIALPAAALPGSTQPLPLRPLLDAGPAMPPRVTSPGLGKILELTQERETMAAEWTQLRDAATYLKLAPPQAESSRAELDALAARLIQVEEDLKTVGERLGQAVAAAQDWLGAPVAQASWLGGETRRFADPLAASLDEVTRAFAMAQHAAQEVLPRLVAAENVAQRRWEAAHAAVYGPPVVSTPAPMYAPAPAAAAPQPAPSPPRPAEITGHAMQEFASLDDEDSGYAAYTYVLLRSASDLDDREVRRRWDNLLSILRKQTPASDVTEADERARLHLFCVPMRPAGNGASSRYDGRLGNQLKTRALTGLFTNGALNRLMTSSPGPFLLTFPTRIGSCKSGTPVLFADLSAHPREVMADLATAYMLGLLKDFPRDQALWRPPALQRVSLTVLQFAAAAGTLLQAAIPGVQAGQH